MKAETQLILVGLGGLAAGAVAMGYAAKQQQAAIAQQAAALAAVNAPQATPQLVSSTGSLNNGWMYFLIVAVPNGDLTNTTTQTTTAAALLAAGFADASTKAAPTLTPVPNQTTMASALTTYTGTTGTAAPAATSTLQYVSILGYPNPEVLSV